MYLMYYCKVQTEHQMRGFALLLSGFLILSWCTFYLLVPCNITRQKRGTSFLKVGSERKSNKPMIMHVTKSVTLF